MRPFLKEFVFTGYPARIVVSCGTSNDKLLRVLKRADIIEDDPALLLPDAAGRTILYPDGIMLMLLREPPIEPKAIGALSHEVFHSVTLLMSHIGIRLTRSSDEAYAYAIGNLTEQILTAFEKHAKKKGK